MNVPVKIPQESELLIESGQPVDFSTPLLKKKGTSTIRIPLAETLKFPPEKIYMHLKKVIGDPVSKGDLIAENKTMFSTKQYVSSVDGVIKEIDHYTGTLTIELQSNEENTISCFFKGEVEELNDGYIELKVNRAQKFDAEETNHYVGAPVFYMHDTDQPLTEDDIYEKIICGSSFNPMYQSKIETLGAKAYISSSKIPLGGVKQIILPHADDLQHAISEKFPYCIIGPDNRSIYFYE